MKLYGSLQNRMEENRQFVEEIKVGTGMTEYLYSDRRPYEVTEVTDQKHVKVRELSRRHVGDGVMDNNWELFSEPSNPEYTMTKRGNYWYFTTTITSDILDELDRADDREKINIWLFLGHNEIDEDDLRKRGKITRYHRANVSFGTAQYYYDYEF